MPASKRTRALLGYLIATGVPQTRQNLCDLLWDGPDDPRAALRWSLSKLRDVVDDENAVRLNADRERVAFLPRKVAIDIQELRALLPGRPEQATLHDLERAAGLLRGEFLDGLDLPACVRFHHWCMTERERFGILRCKVLGELVSRLDDDPLGALPHARALIAADPFSEAAHATLIRLLAKSGRRQEAQAHCQRAGELLRHEVGAAAAETLQTTLREARRRRPSAMAGAPALAAAHPEAAAQPRSEACPPLVGRGAERSRISDIAASLCAFALHRTLLFLGEPGIGKTRLLQALATAASARGALVAFARCYEAEMVRPYGCFMDALRGLPDASIPDVLRTDFPAPPPDQPPTTGAADREQLLGSIAALVHGLASAQPFVLILDDLQWVDEASAALLHFLARSAIPRLLLAGAARAGEIDDNPWAKRLVQSLARDTLLEQLPLAALNCEEIAILAGLEPGSADAAAVFRQSGGNPLLVLELARARQQGTGLQGQSLETLIAGQLARLGEGEREIIVWAAAIGREFRPELLGACLGLGEGVLFGRIERLCRLGLLRPTSDGHFDFAHDLVRQGVYRLQSQPHRRILHRQIARALSAMVADDPSLYGDLVHHAGVAEDHATAVRACIAAGERCLRLFAGPQANEAAERGLAHLEHLSAGRQRIHFQVKLLELKAFTVPSRGGSDWQALLAAMEKATDAAILAGLYGDAAAALHARSWLYWHVNDTAGAQRMTLQAEDISRTADTATRCQQLANTGRCLLDVELSIPRALTLLEQAEAMANVHNLHFAELEWGRALAARWRGDLDRAAECMARALTFVRVSEDHRREAECVIWLAAIALERDDLEGVDMLCGEGARLLEQVDRSSRPVVDALRALMGLRRSQPDAAARLAASLAELRALDDKWRLAYALNTRAAIAMERGEDAAALAAAQEALVAARIMRRPTEIIVATSMLARLAALRGDIDVAGAFLREARTARERNDVGARGRWYLEQAESMIGQRFPTLVQTAVA